MFVTIDENGLVEQALSQKTDPEGDWLRVVPIDPLQPHELGEHEIGIMHVLSPNAAMMSYLTEMGFLAKRPASPVCEEIEGGWRIPSCPIGTFIEVYDTFGDELMFSHTTTEKDEDVDFSLPDVGQYQIEIKAPLPAFPRTVRIEVSE